MEALRIDEIAIKLKHALERWAASRKAEVSIATDPFHVLEILSAGPQGFRLVLHTSSDENPSDQMELPLADNEIEVILSYNLGLTVKPDLALIHGSNNRPSLYHELDDLRAFLLAIAFPTILTATYAIYKGRKPFITPDGIPLAASVLTFHLIAAVNVQPQPIPV